MVKYESIIIMVLSIAVIFFAIQLYLARNEVLITKVALKKMLDHAIEVNRDQQEQIEIAKKYLGLSTKAGILLIDCSAVFAKYENIRIDGIELASVMKARIDEFIIEFEREFKEHAKQYSSNFKAGEKK